jgi:hypothetical protein
MPGTVRPAPSTLGVAGERGSHYERCWQLVSGARLSGGRQVAEASGAAPYSGGVVDRGRAGPKDVAARAGHTSVSFTRDRYGHLYPEADLAVRGRLDGLP